MSEPDQTTTQVIRPPRWTRAMRPLAWWALLVLAMFGYRTHERLIRETRLTFSVGMEGRRSLTEASVGLDGRLIRSGDLIPLGRHTFSISHPQGEPYSTNLFVWYGERNLGLITLIRKKGMLSLAVDPPAPFLSITGPEFRLTLTNSPGMTSSVPSDRYQVEATYLHWEGKTNITVTAGVTTARIAPQLGTVELSCNQADTIFRLLSTGNKVIEMGPFPSVINELPAGIYRVTAKRGDDEESREVTVTEGTTNHIEIEFLYGSGVLETEPPGATVVSRDGRNFGTTPLTLPYLKPGTWEFQLRSKEYETAGATLTIEANQTNVFHTNLVSRKYAAAMEVARRHFADKNFVHASEAATEALKHEPEDPAAKSLQREAVGRAHQTRAAGLAQQGDTAKAITELKAALELNPENAEAGQLLAKLTGQIRQVEEQEARQLTEKREAEERQVRMREVFERLDFASKMHLRGATFPRHDLLATNEVKTLGEAVNKAMREVATDFKVVRYTWDQPDTFVIEGKQQLPDGSRELVIVGAQVTKSECLISFKVMEYQRSNSVSLLGGLATAQITTQADRDGTRAARFQKQLDEGAPMVRERIQMAIRQLATTNE